MQKIFKSYVIVMAIIAIHMTASCHAATFTVVNNCGYTIYPAIYPAVYDNGGWSMAPNTHVQFNPGATFNGRIWGRIACNSAGGCETGECAGTGIQCAGSTGQTGTSLAEFTLDTNGFDDYDVSYVDGMDNPIGITVSNPNCISPNVCGNAPLAECPTALQQGDYCLSACTATGSDQYCCHGAYSTPQTCGESSWPAPAITYVNDINNACPNQYAFAYNDQVGNLTCNSGSSYTITFCPSGSGNTGLTCTPAAESQPVISAGVSYSLTPQTSPCLGLTQTGTTNGAATNLSTAATTWTFTKSSVIGGDYNITSNNGQFCLYDSGSASGSAMTTWACNNTANETFNMVPIGAPVGYYQVQPYLGPAQCVTAAGYTSGSAVTSTTCNSSAAQNWYPQVPGSSTGGAVPSAPTNVTATAGNATVTLSWSPSSGATSYNVYRGTTSGGEGVTPISTGITGTSYSDTTVANGTTYYYTVAAVNASGTSIQSNETSATPRTVPSTPTGLAATAGNAQVVLTWTVATGATSYNIYRSATSGGEGTTVYAASTSASYTDNSVTSGATYYYTVAAVNGAGVSAQSSQVSATPQVPAPGVPSGLTATGGNATITLSWAVGSNATSYNIYRGTTSGGEGTTAYATSTSASYADNSVTNGTTYYYKVASANAAGTSSQSNEASATPSVGATTSGPVSIDCGGSAASLFVADADFSGGSVGATSTAIATPYVSSPVPPQAVLQSWRTGVVTYTLGGFTANTAHLVELYFMEPTATASGQRQFNATVNGAQFLTNFDIYAAAGGQFRAIQENITINANSNGQIVISLTAGNAGSPIVEGISVPN